jgi:putative heme iron utilization protein
MNQPKAPTMVQASRDFVTLHRTGVLSTNSKSNAGFPFGSVVPYDIDSWGRIIIYVALISEHFKNISTDQRASLLILDPYGMHDPQSSARATLLVQFSQIPADDRSAVEESYLARFPGSVNHEIAHNFVYLRAEPKRVRWIGGFGDVGWVDGAEFAKCAPDPLRYCGLEVIEHMNDDHAPALADLVRAYSAFDPSKYLVQMTDLRSTQMSISLSGHHERHEVTIEFTSPVRSAEDCRRVMIELLGKARGILAEREIN